MDLTMLQMSKVRLPEHSIPSELLGTFSFESGGTVQLLHELWSSQEASEALSFFLEAQEEDGILKITGISISLSFLCPLGHHRPPLLYQQL